MFKISEGLFPEEETEDISEDGGHQSSSLVVSFCHFFSSSNKKFTFQICICHFSSTAEKKYVFVESYLSVKAVLGSVFGYTD